jgi:hypothetical protein
MWEMFTITITVTVPNFEVMPDKFKAVSPNIMRVIRSRGMRWPENIARMGEMRNEYSLFFLLEILKGRDHSEDLGIDGKIILEWILGKHGGKCGMDASGSGYGRMAGFCIHGDEPSSYIKGGEFLD